uniref:Uncharacterized protein n=1 Tax=Chrysotila carterae TaxID=13221 RepID=A0A7S4BNZ8_CHRCT
MSLPDTKPPWPRSATYRAQSRARKCADEATFSTIDKLVAVSEGSISRDIINGARVLTRSVSPREHPITPALLISSDTGLSLKESAKAAMASGLRTSSREEDARPPRSRISDATASPAVMSRAATCTSYPRYTPSKIQISLPMPLDPPVTTARPG